MKALSFRQPWAELILQGRKTLDLRTYPTHYRGPLAIHASKTVEREACRRYGLDPNELTTGGVVGIVELVEVVPLTENDYNQRQAEHLAGRAYRDGMHGWVLRDPQRLPELVPAHGRMSLFNIELSLPQADDPVKEPSRSASGLPDSPDERGNGVGQPNSTSTTQPRSKPHFLRQDASIKDDVAFELVVKTMAATIDEPDTTNYALTLRQRVVQPPETQQSFYDRSPAYMTPIVTLSGDNLRAVSDHVLDALREAGYKATDLSPRRRAPFRFPEAVGVRLGLVFLTVKPLSKLDRIEAISHGIRQMTLEELYYWYSKCTATDTAERAQKALRVLLAAE
jgi:hypothetical protein